MTLRKALLAATMLALPMAAAQAQPVTGLYIGAGVGANWRMDPDASNGFDLKTDRVGWAALGAVGWGFGNGLRVELEGNYRFNEISSASLAGARTFSTGHLRTYGAMVNALYDFNMGWPVVPYLGVGVGAAWQEIGRLRGVRPATLGTTAAGYRVDDTEVNFAYQAIVGLAYSLGAMVPGLALTAEYRFFGTLEPELRATLRNPVTNAVFRGNVEPQNFNHSVLIGLRYAFMQPPPPVAAPAAPPAAAPAPARTYLVFFDWDRADLTARAREIIAEAAEASRRVQVTRIEVAGHADRSGSPQYNQRLSQRRADNVAAELVARGVPRNQIFVTAFGESRPLVPTADGVREPQNRRVEIVLR